ncbi:hypothetical protein AX16_003708 [Volvariella volvacea WC 439]|nr:hypothetical protein AX16_003708 [Volvariella volvacea WC 439]
MLAHLHDPASQEYKKARRQYFKATKNRPPTSELGWNPFRAAEKRYKARFPPPDLSDVLDLALLDPSRADEIDQGVWRGSLESVEYIEAKSCHASPAYLIPCIPGLVLLPGFLAPSKQRQLVKWALCRHARQPNETNLDTHYHLPLCGLWNAYLESRNGSPPQLVLPKATNSSVDDPADRTSAGRRVLINNTPASPENYDIISQTPKPPAAPSPTVQPATPAELLHKLRWANIGWYYHWGTKQYDFTRGKGQVDDEIRDVCKAAVDGIDWEHVFRSLDTDWGQNDPSWMMWADAYEPDAGIVNFYQTKDTLMAHVDRSEVCATSPLVSISLGNAAIFLIGGQTRDSEPVPILLRSGDVLIMSGPVCRRAYHGVPRILEGTLPSLFDEDDDKDWESYKEYMQTTRININGVLVDLYVPRKCSATNRLITSKDHASIQINIADVDSSGRALTTSTSFALCGQVRSQGEADDSINRLATKAGPTQISAKERMVSHKMIVERIFLLDNIPGFVALVKREAANPTYLLAWIPESLLNERGTEEWDKFIRIEEKSMVDQEDDDVVLINLPSQRAESYAFSVPLTSIYSLLVHPPSLSSWYGSVGINLINGDTLPTLHFHDDESRSFTASSSPPSRHDPPTYPPSVHNPKPSYTWGGEDLLARLRSYAHILRSTLQPFLFLVDPSRADIETHTTQLFADNAVDDILAQSSYANSHSPVPAHRRPRPLSTPPNLPNPYSQRSSVLHRSLGSNSSSQNTTSQARMALLQSFSNITKATRHAAQNILSHPLAKPIIPHLPDPVRSLVNASGEWEWGSWVEKGGVGEFESARVYLARWARVVAEEGERARRREAQALPSSSLAEEDSSLGVFELLHTTANLPTPKPSRDPRNPVDEKTWEKWFGADGRPVVRIEEMKHEVFRRGISPKGKLRQKLWPFLLGVHAWDVTTEERDRAWAHKLKRYRELKGEWLGVPEVFDRPDVVEERHRIDVDCRRTDRTQPLFTVKNNDSQSEQKAQDGFVTISPNLSDIGAQSPSNEHIERLGGILLTYNFYEMELGYVQGMSDLGAPIYVVMDGDEEMTFWCFVGLMERMKQNFLRDQSGMRNQLMTLQQLIGVMDPELYRHLDKRDGLNLFFCFRWILIHFKREFPFDDVLRLWEVLWTDYYSNDFVLFVAFAVLESHRDMILRYLVEFDEILKYCNELSMTIELDSTLAQAEVLFLSFAQLVADIDHRNANERAAGSGDLRRRRSASEPTAANHTAVLPDNLRSLTYALSDPSKLPPSVLFSHTPSTLVIYDAFPKSTFHFLVLPRPSDALKASDLKDLWTLLKGDKERARGVVEALGEAARALRAEIEEEMLKRYGFKWDVWMGFHANPSMEHLHLHVISEDLCSSRLKNKRHYNSFHPKLGFFIHLTDVLEWFDAEPSYYTSIIRDHWEKEQLLKEPLACWKCGKEMKNMPTLKEHLQQEQDLRSQKSKSR